jgi:hypothetical protein
MEHVSFPVKGFEFMDESATEMQKHIIVELCGLKGIDINANGVWPDPFSKWDAANMIEGLKEIRK